MSGRKKRALGRQWPTKILRTSGTRSGRRLIALDRCVALDEPRAAGDNLSLGMRAKGSDGRGEGAGLVKIVGVEQAYDFTTRRRDSLFMAS